MSILSDNIGMVYSGMGPDSRVLLRKGRKIAMEYNLYYKDPIPVQEIVHKLASVMQDYTQSGYVCRFHFSEVWLWNTHGNRCDCAPPYLDCGGILILL